MSSQGFGHLGTRCLRCGHALPAAASITPAETPSASHAAPKVSLVTRLEILNDADMARWVAENLPGEDPAGVLNAAAAPDHSVIVVRSSLTRPQRRRAVHEALAGVRRYPRIT